MQNQVLRHREPGTITTHELFGIPGGAEGTRQTLRIMRELVREWKIHPRLRQLAKKIVQGCPSKNIRCEVSNLHRYVSNTIRYVRDVQGVETVQAPDVTLRDKSGDCDDQAVLIGALLCSIGHPVRFMAVGFRPGRFAHVYAETPIGPDWVAVETTMKGWPIGRKPRGVIHMVQKV